MIVTVDQAKEQLNITDAVDDALLGRKLAAAQDHLERLLGFRIEEKYPSGIPPSLVECVCLLAAHWYENREASLVGVNAQPLPFGISDIVDAHRNYSWGLADDE